MDESMIAALAADPRAKAVKASLLRSGGKSIEGDGITEFLHAVCEVGLGSVDMADVLSALFLHALRSDEALN